MANKERCEISDKLESIVHVRVTKCIKELYQEYFKKHHIRNPSDVYRAAVISHIYKLLGWD